MDPLCPQCGGVVQSDDDSSLVTCAFCGSSLYLDPGSAVSHEILPPTLRKAQLAERIGSFLSQRETLGRPKRLRARLLFLPYWVVPRPEGERVAPAAALGALPLARYVLPSGDFRRFSPVLTGGAEVVPASVMVESLLPPARGSEAEAVPKGTRLVHLPFWEVRYRLGARDYRALVDAAAGQVLPFSLPVSSELWLDWAYSALLGVLFVVLVLGFRLLFAGDTAGWLWLGGGAPVAWAGVRVLGLWSAA